MEFEWKDEAFRELVRSLIHNDVAYAKLQQMADVLEAMQKHLAACSDTCGFQARRIAELEEQLLGVGSIHLEARVAELESALRPFSKAHQSTKPYSGITLHDLRMAFNVMQMGGDDSTPTLKGGNDET